MKKYLFCIIVLAFAVNYAAQAQSPNKLISEFAKAENAEEINDNGLFMKTGKKLSKDNVDKVIENIDEAQVIDLRKCSDEIKSNFLKEMKNLKDVDGYETLIMVKEEDSNVRIMVKKDLDIIKEIIILVYEQESPVIVKVTGNIHEKDIDKLIQKNKKQ